jgi:hypothetical protein
MIHQIQQVVNNPNKTKAYLILANILLVFFLILLNNFKVIPLRIGDFIFIAVLTLAFALYRPGWAFLFFIGTIALENISLAPVNLGIAVRPYQLLGALIILAVAVRFFSKKLYFKLPKLVWFDYLLLIVTLSGFLSIISAPDKIASFKLAIILATFFALYYLVRIYIQNSADLKRIIPFFISSGIIVIFYGIWQNWRFMHNLPDFETMPGRPNGTFTESDWLGMYLVILIGAIYSVIFYLTNITENTTRGGTDIPVRNLKLFFLYLFLISTYILLILTVSRSAWLGAFFVTFVFLWAVFTDFKLSNWQWWKTIKIKLGIICSLIIAIAIVHTFHLTNFQLLNRVQSTGTGLQKITISCEKIPNLNINSELGPVINMQDLESVNCKHINLEDIELEKQEGKYVTEVYREDPNVNIRSEIYKKSWEQIKNHPLLGIGWGNISNILGKDERGVGLNSSNIFFEVYLGSGIIGFLAFFIFWSYAIFNSIKNFYFSTDVLQRAIYLFIVSSWLGLTIYNLFNAGVMLGFLWAWMGLAAMNFEIKKPDGD